MREAVAHAFDEQRKTFRSLVQCFYDLGHLRFSEFDRLYPWFSRLTSLGEHEDMMWVFAANALGKPVGEDD